MLTTPFSQDPTWFETLAVLWAWFEKIMLWLEVANKAPFPTKPCGPTSLLGIERTAKTFNVIGGRDLHAPIALMCKLLHCDMAAASVVPPSDL